MNEDQVSVPPQAVAWLIAAIVLFFSIYGAAGMMLRTGLTLGQSAGATILFSAIWFLFWNTPRLQEIQR